MPHDSMPRSIIGQGDLGKLVGSMEQARTEICCYQLTAEGVRLKTVCLLYCKKKVSRLPIFSTCTLCRQLVI